MTFDFNLAGELINEHLIDEQKDINNIKVNAMNTFFQNYINDEKIDYAEKWDSIIKLDKMQRTRNKLSVFNKAFSEKSEFDSDFFSLNNISEDWLIDFMDKVEKVSNEEFQIVWSKLLLKEAENPGIVPKKVLHTLFLMDSDDAKNFVEFTRFCFADGGKNHYNLYHPIVFFKRDSKKYESFGLNLEQIESLENLGLIMKDFNNKYCFKNKKILYYKDKYIVIKADEIDVGNIKLTKVGQSLINIINIVHNDVIFKHTIELWKKDGCLVQVNNKFL